MTLPCGCTYSFYYRITASRGNCSSRDSNTDIMRRRKKDKVFISSTSNKPSSYAAAAAIGTEDSTGDIMLDNNTNDYAMPGRTMMTMGTAATKNAGLRVPESSSSSGSSNNHSSSIVSLLAMAKSRSPPQQPRRRGGLLALGGSVRELVEQVGDFCFREDTKMVMCPFFISSFFAVVGNVL